MASLPAPPSLKARALRLLSQREHSRQELERKLARFEQEPGSLAAALDDLLARGFISEQRVLDAVVHARAPKWGERRLRQALQAKGLDGDAVAQALHDLGPSEAQRARAVWQKKFGVAPTTPQERARQLRFMAGRGFSSETVARVLRAPDESLRDEPPPWTD